MSAADGDFVVALFTVGTLPLAVDASGMMGIELDHEDAVDPAGLFALERTGTEARCARFRFDDAELLLRLGDRVDVVSVSRSMMFALPALLEDLEQRAVLGLVRYDARLWTILDARLLCERQAALHAADTSASVSVNNEERS